MKHMYVTKFYNCVYMSYKTKVVFICRIKKHYVFICHLILNDIYIQA